MKYKVIGPRILLKVKNYNQKDQTFEGSSILMSQTSADMETINQSTGEVIQLGNMAYKRKDAFCDNESPCRIGDIVHFCRHGAMRLSSNSNEEFQYWVVMDKDVFCIEEA